MIVLLHLQSQLSSQHPRPGAPVSPARDGPMADPTSGNGGLTES